MCRSKGSSGSVTAGHGTAAPIVPALLVLSLWFRSSSDAGYLGLIAPDGTTVLSEYDPYPAQVSNVSYGISVNETTTPLVGPQATVAGLDLP